MAQQWLCLEEAGQQNVGDQDGIGKKSNQDGSHWKSWRAQMGDSSQDNHGQSTKLGIMGEWQTV